jgi:hypothetical protein
MQRRLETFGQPIADRLEALQKPEDILNEFTRVHIATNAMRDAFCSRACTSEDRPSIHYAITGFNTRQYWSWAILSDFQVQGDNFIWYTDIDDYSISRIAPCLLEQKLVKISRCEISFDAHDFIRNNQYRYCTPYADPIGVEKYFPNWTITYNSSVTGSISYLEDTETFAIPVSRRASPETNYGLKLKDSMPIIAYRANDSSICFAESILSSLESALKSRLDKSIKDFGLFVRCFDAWVNQSSSELSVDDKLRIIQMAFKATAAKLVEHGLLPPLFYRLATREYLQFVSSGRIADSSFKGIHSQLKNYSHRNGFICSYGEYYFKSIGLKYESEIQGCIPGDVENLFEQAINGFARLKQIRRVNRKIRCTDQSLENRLSIAKQFIRSAYERCKGFEIKVSRESFSKANIEDWMSIHGNTLAEMIYAYQQSNELHFFHIDHVIPLAAMPDDYIVDINSPAWHPVNLAIIPEEENIAKNSLFNGKIIRRKDLSEETQREAVAMLIEKYIVR